MSMIVPLWTRSPDTCRRELAQRCSRRSTTFIFVSSKAENGVLDRHCGSSIMGELSRRYGIDWTVVYPTAGLAVGRIIAEDWVIAACRAYDNWLYEKFTNVNSRIKGMALSRSKTRKQPCGSCDRWLKSCGWVGAMLPSNGEGIKSHFGSKIYWPIYEEAEKLDCPVAVHVGSLHHLGMDTIGVYYAVYALGHPFGIMGKRRRCCLTACLSRVDSGLVSLPYL